MKDKTVCEQFSATFPFWKNLSEDEKNLICENTVSVTYPKGKTIHRGSEDCQGIVVVKKGQLRTYMMSEDGRDVTLYRLFDGDVCILSASCVLDAITFDVFIDAQEETQAFLINSAVFHKIADENVYVKCFAYQLATVRFSDVMWAMQQILFMGADKRLAIFLWDEMTKSSDMCINMTHEQIAKYIGSAREVVTRMLRYFASEGIAELSRGSIRIIDKEKLRELTK